MIERSVLKFRFAAFPLFVIRHVGRITCAGQFGFTGDDQNEGKAVRGIHSGSSGRYAVPPGATLFGRLGSNRPIAGSLILLLMLGLLSITNMVPAFASATYQINSQWIDPPASIARNGVAVSEWRINVNDDAAAPTNAPVPNVTFAVTATNGLIAEIPDICLTTGVTPASSISVDGRTLTCNVGTQNMGTAIVVQVPVTADGAAGGELSITGTTNGTSAPPLNPIPIVGAFGMDMKWDGPSATVTRVSTTAMDFPFEWTLNLLKGSEPGPDSVSYTINLSSSLGGAATTPRCGPFSNAALSSNPYSGGSHPTEQVAPFVGSCTLTPTGTPNQYTMTLTGIDYSLAQVPTEDSSGNLLPTDRAAVASGQVIFRFPVPTGQQGNVAINVSAPTYTSADGTFTSVDGATNNAAQKTFTAGNGWASAFERSYTSSGGTFWDNNYRIAPGTEMRVVNNGAVASTGQVGQLCSVVDTAYAQTTKLPTLGVNGEFGSTEVPGVTVWYYTGNAASLIPGATYNPQAFAANCDAQLTGWSTTPPADLSTIKATRAVVDGSVSSTPSVRLNTFIAVKDGVPAGQDVWEFGSAKMGGTAVWNYSTARHAVSVDTPGARFPYTSPWRDIVRVVALDPYVEKSVDRASVKPGVPATFTVGYAANGGSAAPPTADDFTITDTLPLGMTYVAGSASPEPVISTDAQGRQVLTWTLNGVTTNVLHSLTYQAVVGSNAKPGQILTNSVTTAVNGRTSLPATASVTVSTNGSTTIGKTADAAFIPNVAGDGAGAGSWTVTVRSFDPTPQAFTDTIDILPYNGDGRGTTFTGSYALTGVTAVDGATVYYTDATPGSLSDDPADAANGSAGSVSGNTVGWTTTKPANPTAVRVIGPALAPGATQAFNLAIQTTGATGGDVLVNRAQARAEHTKLAMLTSAPITVAKHYTASLKKEVKDRNGVWHDANDVVDYPTFRTGDTVPYRITVTNMGEGTLTNIKVADDKFPAEGGFSIASLDPGASQSHEFSITLGAGVASTFVNTASASADVPKDSQVPPTINIDPAGIEVANYTTVKTSDPASGTTVASGQKVTYTVTVTQNGSAPATASFTDDLTAVLDDADYNKDAAASIGTVSVVGGGLSWNGTVPVGGTATITYSVTVKATSGDKTLTNVVTSDGCVPTDGQTPDCTTTHRVSLKFLIEKIGESSDSTWVPMAGSTWAIHDDANGAPGDVNPAYPVTAIPNQTGRFQVEGIVPGEYWLEETTAPDGFNLLAEPVHFTVAADGAVTLGEGSGGGVVTAGDEDGDGIFLVTVRDVPALQMPETGGIGSWPFALAGSVLLLAAAVLAAGSIRRRRHQPTA